MQECESNSSTLPCLTMHSLPDKKVDLDLTTPGGIREYLQGTAFESVQEPVALAGGSGNFTYRVALRVPVVSETTIVKHAAPFVASYPDWPLDPARTVSSLLFL
jgi:hypothetical protein